MPRLTANTPPRTRRLGLRLLAAVSSGAALYWISPPFSLYQIHWISFVPLLWALRDDDDAGNLTLAYIGGYTGVSTCFFWLSESIVRFSSLPPFLGFQTIHLFALAFALPYALVFGLVHPLRRRWGTWWVAAVPTLQVAVEFWGPSLFPYYQGVSQYRAQATWQIVSVTGVMGLSWLVMFTNCVLAEQVYRRREGRGVAWAPLVTAAALVGANLGFGAWRVARLAPELAEWPRGRFSQIQLDVTMAQRMQMGWQSVMTSWLDRTASLAGQDLDLVVWPEGATPYDPRKGNVAEIMGQLASHVGAPIAFGGGFRDEVPDPATGKVRREARNSVYLVEKDGTLQDRYDKIVPLPFGEYIPFSDTFPFLKEIIQGPGDFKPGDRAVEFTADANGQPFTFTTPICYEGILSELVRTRLSNADVIVVVTNDAWFGDTSAPHQHAMLTAVRATELGVPMYRLGYTGVSFVVDPLGGIHDETKPFTVVTRVVEVPLGRFPTLYSRLGDWFPWTCTGLVLFGLVLSRWRKGSPAPA